MKLLIPITLAVAALCVGCASTDSTPFQQEIEGLGESTKREQLYAIFPPREKPKTRPVIVTSNGASGYEDYPISDQWEISYTVRYAASPGHQEHLFMNKNALRLIPSPMDVVSKIEVRERKE